MIGRQAHQSVPAGFPIFLKARTIHLRVCFTCGFLFGNAVRQQAPSEGFLACSYIIDAQISDLLMRFTPIGLGAGYSCIDARSCSCLLHRSIAN